MLGYCEPLGVKGLGVWVMAGLGNRLFESLPLRPLAFVLELMQSSRISLSPAEMGVFGNYPSYNASQSYTHASSASGVLMSHVPTP